MDPITAGLVAGGMGLVGSEMTNRANTDIAQQASMFNAQQSQTQRDWQERMSNTQYQRAVADLQAAGLNPMLAYTQGGAGVPSGAAASAVQAAPRHNALGEAATSTLNTVMAHADLKIKAEQVNATNAQAEQSRTQALANIANSQLALTNSDKSTAEIDTLKKQLEVQAAQITNLSAGATASSAAAAASRAQAAKTTQETDLGIVSSNPVTQAWGEIKRGAAYVHSKFAPNLEKLGNATMIHNKLKGAR